MMTSTKKLTLTQLVFLIFLIPSYGQEYIDYQIRSDDLYARVSNDEFLEGSGAEEVVWKFQAKMSSSSSSGTYSSMKTITASGNYEAGLTLLQSLVTLQTGTCLDNEDNLYVYIEGWEDDNNNTTFDSGDDDYRSDTDYDVDISANTRNSWVNFNSNDNSGDYANAGTVGATNGDYRVEIDVWWDWSLPVSPPFILINVEHESFTIDFGSTNYRVTSWDYQVSTVSDFSNIVVSGTVAEDVSITGLTSYTDYYVRILGSNERGSGSYTSYQSVKTKGVIYVDTDATEAGGVGTNTGTSWADAFPSFQSALDYATANAGYYIWVAAGTYTPSVEVGGVGDRYQTFQMIEGVEIYGGFNGSETSISEREIGTNETILSGEIGTASASDNCYHVFYHPSGLSLTNSAVLDGFTITKGYKGSSPFNKGSGMYNDGSSPTIRNCKISNNTSYNGGGFYFNNASSPIITNTVFVDNTASFGGAIYSGGTSQLEVINCTFTGNNGGAWGGAIENVATSLTAKNCIFWGNTAVGSNSNEIYNSSSKIATFYNCNIEGGVTNINSNATDGGGNINADPLFTDSSGEDYRLTSHSPCADAGLVGSNTEATDIRGNGYGRTLLKTDASTTGTIDIGAYEFNSNTDPLYPTLYWNAGASTSDWNTATNWDAEVIPTSDYSVTIPTSGFNPVIGPTQTSDCNNLTIESGAALTIQSSSSGTGSLIINGTLSNSGTITSQRYFPGSSLSWHMVSTPVANMSIAASGFAPTSGDFYAWDEPTPGTWVNYKQTTGDLTFNGVNGGDNFVAAKGYLLAFVEEAPTHSFIGSLNTGDQTFTLKNSIGKDWTYAKGWNLMGNPYSSAIDWNLVSSRSLFIDDFAYAYNPQKNGVGGFEEIDGSSANAYVGAHQGFFVIANPGTANNKVFTFTNAMQTHGGAYYKNITEDDKLVLRLIGELYYDETTIRLRDESTYNKDRVDAYKMNSYNVNAPNFYSISDDNINLAINSIPQIDTEHNIRVGIVASKNGLYTIKVVEASNSMLNNNIYLEDLLLNKWHKISESDYSFTTEAGDLNDRFIIHFGVVGMDEPITPNNSIQLWSSNSKINIYNPQSISGKIKVYNMYGQVVEQSTLNRNTNQQIILNVPMGYYIVNIVTSKEIINKKVYLK